MQALRYILVLSVAALALAGCAASTSPAFDARFGDGVRVLRAQQTLDLAAPQRNAGQMVRSDGKSANEATNQYVNSFKAPPAPAAPTINFNAGGSSSNGGGAAAN